MTKEKAAMCYIYGIYNKLNGKLYIGITTNCEKRWKRHQKMVNPNVKIKHAIHWALNKYGIDNFIFKQIEELNDWKFALQQERAWIKALKELGHQLYNETDGGEGSFGVRRYGKDNPNFGKPMKPHVKKELLKHRRKLSDEQIKEIQILFANNNYTQTKLSKQFNVSLTQIHRIVKGKSWGDKDHDAILTKKNMTADDARMIKIMYATDNYTQKELAKRFNCSANHIYRIISGKKWKNI